MAVLRYRDSVRVGSGAVFAPCLHRSMEFFQRACFSLRKASMKSFDIFYAVISQYASPDIHPELHEALIDDSDCSSAPSSKNRLYKHTQCSGSPTSSSWGTTAIFFTIAVVLALQAHSSTSSPLAVIHVAMIAYLDPRPPHNPLHSLEGESSPGSVTVSDRGQGSSSRIKITLLHNDPVLLTSSTSSTSMNVSRNIPLSSLGSVTVSDRGHGSSSSWYPSNLTREDSPSSLGSVTVSDRGYGSSLICLSLMFHAVLLLTLFTCMQNPGIPPPPPPGGPGQAARGARLARVADPPSWDPSQERTYPFRLYTQKLMIWGILAAEMDPGQQAAAIANQLRGDAQQLAYNLSYQDLATGGVINGVRLDPVTYLMTQLAAHFAPLGEEARLASMGEIMSFHRNPSESTDALIARVRILRWRAAQGGAGVQMS